jgi:hypothetical protein
MLRCLRIPGCCTRSRVEYGGTHAGRQQSFPGLVLVVLLAVVLVLLFDFLNRSVPIAALASVVLSRSEVVSAVPVARTIFKICSLTGLILVLGMRPKTESCRWIPSGGFAVGGSLQEKTWSRAGTGRRRVGAGVGRAWRWSQERFRSGSRRPCVATPGGRRNRRAFDCDGSATGDNAGSIFRDRPEFVLEPGQQHSQEDLTCAIHECLSFSRSSQWR